METTINETKINSDAGEILFIKENTPELRNKLLALGLKHSEYCNEGIYLSVENGVIFQLNHEPYRKHKLFNSDVELINEVKLQHQDREQRHQRGV